MEEGIWGVTGAPPIRTGGVAHHPGEEGGIGERDRVGVGLHPTRLGKVMEAKRGGGRSGAVENTTGVTGSNTARIEAVAVVHQIGNDENGVAVLQHFHEVVMKGAEGIATMTVAGIGSGSDTVHGIGIGKAVVVGTIATITGANVGEAEEVHTIVSVLCQQVVHRQQQQREERGSLEGPRSD